MQFSIRRVLFAVALATFSLVVPSFAQSDPLTIANSFVDANAGSFGLTAPDLDRRVSDNYRNRLNGVTHIYYLQRHAGIDVFNAMFSLAVTPSGQVVFPKSRFVPNLAQRVNTTIPLQTAQAALASAATNLGMSSATSMTPPKLIFVPSGSAVRLAWDLTVEQDRDHIWIVKIDAVNGALLHKMNMVQHDNYKVYAWPAESPNHVGTLPLPPSDGRTVVTESAADATASPFGWHDTNGVAGADTQNTTGNNVAAQTDLALVPGQPATSQNRFKPGVDVQPTSTTRDFVYPIDLTKNPETYREALVTNLFYWNNVIHDIMYKYGFDEVSGNFQRNNYGKGGAANDAVIADAQDGSGTNNANFATPNDGSAPRMQMYIWDPSKGNEVVVHSPAGLGTFQASPATFGRRLDAAGVRGDVVLVNDGAGVTWDFCEPMAVGSLTGKIALAERGTCNFTVKAQNADRAGAAGLIVVNNAGDNETLTMGSLTPQTDALILTPSQMIGRRDGNNLKNSLPANVTMRNVGGEIPRRDSDFDNAVIVHEYGHGISTRLTGGPAVNTCLQTPQQGGEGWSDWFALVLTAREGDTATKKRGIGTYLTYEDNTATALGIRPYPYTTDMTVNPQTYGDLSKGTLSVPHGVGSVWATTLWDMYWALVGGVAERGLPALGFRQNLYDTTTQPLAGNQIALRLVMDGLKLQPCDPSILEARDAILEADRINFGGAHACYIWWAFARRGQGVNAQDGDDSLDVTQDFSAPQACTAGACQISPKFLGAHSVVSATDGTTKLTVRWDAATLNCGTSVSYNVYRSTESNFIPAATNQIATGVTGTSYVDTTVASGVRYFYVVRAKDNLNNVEGNVRRRSGVPVGMLMGGAVFFDDGGDTRPTQFTATSAVRSWAIRTAEGLANTRAYATSASGNYPNIACMQLESDTIYLGPDPDLQFLSSWQIEPAWDGGIVEVATEGGKFSDWTKLNTIQYPGVMNGPDGDPACSNPGLKDGERAFNGANPAFAPSLGSLAQWANQNVRVRFVFGSDSGTELGGWLIDNISVDDVRATGVTTCFEESDGQFAYSNGWHRVNDSGASGGSFRVHFGNNSTHKASFDFNVTRGPAVLTYHYPKSSLGGTADVYVDGVFKGSIDYRASGRSWRPQYGFTFNVEGLAAGAHKFELRNLRGAVAIDKICITNGHASGLPVVIPGVTTTSVQDLGAAQQLLQSVSVPVGATELSVVAESDPDAQMQMTVTNASGNVVGSATGTGFTVVDFAVPGAGVYTVKVVNLSTRSANIWTASTPLIQK